MVIFEVYASIRSVPGAIHRLRVHTLIDIKYKDFYNNYFAYYNISNGIT